jgi:hypothetical protein
MRKRKIHHTFLGGKRRRRHMRIAPPPSQLVTVCAWCPDKEEQTASARAHGFDVTHGICDSCKEKHFRRDA